MSTQAKAPYVDWRLSWRKRMRIGIIAFVCKLTFHALCTTMQFRRVSGGTDAVDAGIDSGIIVACYHGEHFPIVYDLRDRGITVITSQSADGELLSRILHSFGYLTVRGSSSRGGVRALVDLARVLRSKGSVAIAVDGPRGPRHEVKPGAILLGKLSGKPVIPFAASTTGYWQIKSWDRFRLPKPFCSAQVMVDEPMFVPADASDQQIEELSLELKRRLDALQEKCDASVLPPASR